MKKVLFVIGLLFIVTSCCSDCGNSDTLLKVESDYYEITDMHRRKHNKVNVTLKRRSDGRVFENLEIGKCNSYKETVLIGRIVKLKRLTYTDNGLTDYTKFNQKSVNKCLCN